MNRSLGLNFKNFSPGFKRWAVTLLFLPVVVFYRFFEGIPAYANFQLEGRITRLGVGGLVIVVWMAARWWGSWKPRRPVHSGLFVLAGSFLMLQLAVARGSELSLNYTIMTGGYLVAGMLFLDLKAEDLLWESLITAVILTSWISYIYLGVDMIRWWELYQVGFSDLRQITYVLDTIPRLQLTLSSNVLAVNLLLVLPLGLYRLGKREPWWERGFYGLFVLISLLALILTRSRGAMIGLAALVGTGLALYFWNRIRREEGLNRSDSVIMGSAGLVLLGIGFVFLSRGIPDTLVDVKRWNNWATALKLIRDNALWGIDPGTYGLRFLSGRNPGMELLLTVHPHNQALNFIVQYGLVGGLLAGWGIWKLFRGINWKSMDSQGLLSLPVVSTLGAAGFLGHGLVDSFLNLPQVMYLFLVLLVSVISTNKQGLGRSKGRVSLVAVTTVVVLLGAGSGLSIWRQIPYEKARRAASQPDPNHQEIISYLQQSVRRTHGKAYSQRVLFLVLGRQALNSGHGFEDAFEAADLVLNDYRGYAPAHVNLGAVYQTYGAADQALDQYQQAVLYHPDTAEYYCALGEILLELDQEESGLQAFASCLTAGPGRIKYPYWDRTINRRQKMEVINRAEDHFLEELALDPEGEAVQWRLLSLYFHAGKTEAYQQLFEKISENSTQPWRAAGWRGMEEVRSGDVDRGIVILEDVVKQEPRQAGYWRLLGEAYLKSGELEKAQNALRIALALRPSSAVYSLVGQYHQAAGQPDRAEEYYRLALLNLGTPATPKLATWTANRYPFPVDWVGGLPELYSEMSYDLPLRKLSDLLVGQACDRQAEIYLQFLNQSPWLTKVEQRYRELPCVP